MAGLEDLYREIILDHYRSPRNRGELAVPPAHRVEGFNPLCGDEVVVYLEVNDGVLTDLRMPGVSGLELIDTLRDELPNLPVVLMTAHGTTETAIEATRPMCPSVY